MTGMGSCVKKLYFEKEQSINDKMFCIMKINCFLGDILLFAISVE